MAGRLVVIGGDAGGMAAASQARREDPSLEIVALERTRWTSYSACGIPYLLGGEVADLEALVSRSPQEHRDKNRIDVRMRHEAMGIDLDKRTVEVRNHEHGRTYQLGFDALHLATGGRPARPDLPGSDLPFVGGVQTLDDAQRLLNQLTNPPVWAPRGIKQAVVVGGGYIGLEMAEAFLHRGIPVTVVTNTDEVMPNLDPDMGALVSAAMRREGVVVRCGEAVIGFEPGAVLTDGGRIEADIVVLGTGVAPNSELAADAGIELGHKGAVTVDRRQRASHEGVWAAGDCADSLHLVSGRRVHIALGTVANKQGRVAGINLGGGYATFPGVVGTAVTKLCSVEIGRTGLSEAEATEAGFAWDTTRIESSTRAGYFPGSGPITVKVIVERRSGRLLGGQIVGEEGAAKRIDVLATCLHAGMDVEQMTALDLSYAPPFSPVWDPVLVAARKAASALGD